MAPVTALFAAALLVSAAVATPVVRDADPIVLPFTRERVTDQPINVLAADQARVKARKAQFAAPKSSAPKSGAIKSAAAVNVPITNIEIAYIAKVAVGSPATTFNLVVDTASSNTWVGAGTKFKATSTTINTGVQVSQTYGTGDFSGVEELDQVSIATGLVISQQSIGVASSHTGFDGVDGVLGVGPVALTQGTLANGNTIPTVTDNLFAQGTIPQNLIAISFNPSSVNASANGVISFGQTVVTEFTGALGQVPITTISPSSVFWGVSMSMNYAGQTSLVGVVGAISDSGSALILIATDAFKKYQSVTGAVLDGPTGLLKVTAAQFSGLRNLNFNVGGFTLALPPNGQIWPRALNTDLEGGVAGNIYLIVNDIGENSGSGLDIILGMAFLERFYTTYNTATKQVGFATTPFTSATTN